MIEISVISSNSKEYSIKSKLTKINDDAIKIKILTVDEINKVSSTSFTRLKNIYDYRSIDAGEFNIIKFNDLFNKLIKNISNKYKVKNVTYSS